ncbi:hypothetical protein G5V58_25020 [Nocardioides anomalus]|uniref:Uncharacterized protein n=1 Tax=Nocardioides anomalus TaxID=2712223 RepID=A0A6G6WKA9_9ACTN|nr:hypothetical protein [Nocardioides anomalus]QIG45573.1 hypothetical protein G5V58_25020 [Nocardioides anomalus]
MPDHFSASETPAALETVEDLDQGLAERAERDAEARLLAALDRVEQRVQAVRADDADRPLEPAVADAMARAAEADGAPFEARWLAGKVAESDLTWAAVWRAPEDHEGGLWLWSRATRELSTGTAQ